VKNLPAKSDSYLLPRCFWPPEKVISKSVNDKIVIFAVRHHLWCTGLSCKYAVMPRIKGCFFAAFAVFMLVCTDVFGQYDIDRFYIRGRQALIEGKYSSAIENFNILARLDPSGYETYFFRGIAKYNLGDFRGALDDFDKAVEINPVYTDAYHYRGITLSRIGKYDEALEDMDEAISLRPDFVPLYFSRGVTYFLSRQFEKAVGDFDRFIIREPEESTAYLNRGATYLFLGDTLDALNDYNKAIKLNRFDPEGYIRRGRLYAMSGNLTDALADMDKAIVLDTSNTFAYFNRAILRYDSNDIAGAMADLNRVLEDEPGNALTLYNRALIRAQMTDYEGALEDFDRVININPRNVLAYFNRASIFIEMGRYWDAVYDYDKAIELYPDFAKAYMNRSYLKNLMGFPDESKKDYETAQRKIREYQQKVSTAEGASAFADTAKQFSSLLTLDAEFAQKDFNDELLQYRDVDVRLRSMYKVVAGSKAPWSRLDKGYENPTVDSLLSLLAFDAVVSNEDRSGGKNNPEYSDFIAAISRDLSDNPDERTLELFAKGILESAESRFSAAMDDYGSAISASGESPLLALIYMNRGVLQADMIDFISSMQHNVQVLTLDNRGSTTTARVQEQSMNRYDYSEAIGDMIKASMLYPEYPYVYFNLGNLFTLSSEHTEAIKNYTKAIELFPYFGDAYFNRGLVLIYLRDKEKGCIDLSKAGELGVDDAYSVINQYCEEDNGGL